MVRFDRRDYGRLQWSVSHVDGIEEMTGSLGDSPAGARQRVRRELRRARGSTDLTQGDVAKRLGWSLSKVQRIEAGEVAVSETDLRALLTVYSFSDDHIVESLVADARLARRERWLTTPEHRKHLPSGLLKLFQFERSATGFRLYEPNVIPGALQTPEAAQYIINEYARDDDPERRKVMLDVRMQRRDNLLQRPDKPPYSLILDEAVIRRQVGGPKIMAEQLDDLAEIASRPNFAVRLVPFEKGGFISYIGSFMLLDLSDDADDLLLYRESFYGDSVAHDAETTGHYRKIFDDVWRQSFSEDASLRRIMAMAASLRASLDDP